MPHYKQFVAPKLDTILLALKIIGRQNYKPKRLNNIVPSRTTAQKIRLHLYRIEYRSSRFDGRTNNTFYTIQALQHGRLEGRDDFSLD